MLELELFSQISSCISSEYFLFYGIVVNTTHIEPKNHTFSFDIMLYDISHNC